MFKGAGGYENSRVAGAFTDVPVEIDRDPPRCEAPCR